MAKVKKGTTLSGSGPPTITYVFFADYALLYHGCEPSLSSDDFFGNFDQKIFEEDLERYRPAWERLAEL